ncbi:B12-binding domain-containing radical SAM protein [Spirochaeta isovalerica]|uniref:Elp3/MiaA/NifB-like radical SAM core domain-containing protein n=1 Tax=Spirochaeta isovalerica TaxID=150 RepID=A0A841R8V4_9SPIO|nr:radical SAM protein [Spirochaeta isovalerica]MBB6480333.1 hypothetical protein [Spirochaeta isovalerica]
MMTHNTLRAILHPMLLIHPPQARNCEPPIALVHLAGALRAAGEPVIMIDGSLEGYIWLTEQPRADGEDRHAARVYGKRDKILSFPGTIASLDNYKRQIHEIKLLASSSRPVSAGGIRISPADYDDPLLNPLRSKDLIKSWENPEENLFYPWFRERLAPLLEKNGQSAVGISISYLSQALTGLAICGWIKKCYPRIRIQVGGGLINSWLKGPSDMSFLYGLADNIYGGNGEEAIVRFAGRTYKGPGRVWYGDLYNREAPYLSPGRILPYSGSRGCSWKRCTFCSEKWEDNPYCETAASAAADDLFHLSEKYNPSLIHLCDSEISPLLMDEMIKRPPGPLWYGFSRFLPAMMNEAYCRNLAESGCRMLCLGLESGDQQVLNSLKKGIRLDMVSRILKNLKAAGISTYVYIMFGTPAERRDSAERTRDFVAEHSPYIDFLNVSIFNMPVNSEEASGLESGSFYDGDLSLYREFAHPEGWNRNEIRTFLAKDFRSVPEIRRILNRNLPVFTSNHAAFFTDSVR